MTTKVNMTKEGKEKVVGDVWHFSWAPAYVGPIFIVSSELFGTFQRLPSVVGKYYTYYCNL